MSSSYDRAITVFSPDGRLFQVDYAQEAVRKGSSVVGICGKDCVVLGVEKKSIPTLQDDRTIRKIVNIHDHIMLAFAGLSADARVIVDYSRRECESYKLTLDDLPKVWHVALKISDLKQAYTQTGGRRPFGVSTLLGGIDADGTPRLFKTEPSGVFFEYLATTVGRNEKVIREYLELYYKDENIATEELVLKLAIKALSQAVQSVASNIEIAVISINKEISEQGRDLPAHCVQRVLSTEEVEGILSTIEKERLEAEESSTKK